MTNCIKNLLRIKEPNLEITDVTQEKIQNQQTNIIHAVLSPAPENCSTCGSTPFDKNGKQIIVKNGKKIVCVRLNEWNGYPLVMHLAKQRYKCKNCATSWTAQTNFVNPHQSISRQVKCRVIELLKEQISLKLIGKLCSVSSTTVIRFLRELSVHAPQENRPRCLPNVLMVDEFRSHVSSEDKMSFICADGETGELIDILPTRKLDKLVSFYQGFRNPENVKFLVTDMNAAYFQLTNKVFPNAKIVIDNFHIIKHLNKAFNDFRVQEIKKLQQPNKVAYNKLKKNWRVLLKNRSNIDHYEYKSWRSFPTPKHPLLTEAMMIDRLLDYSEAIKETYKAFHQLCGAFRGKEPNLFFEILRSLPSSLDEQFRNKCQNLLNYEEGIRNAMIYPYSNGKIEAKNTHIKTLKRVSYGFRSFTNMRLRIFMINGLIG